MTFAYFASFHDRTDPAVQLSQADKTRVIDIVRTTPGLIRGLVFTPETTRDPYAHDGASPQLALELYFADIPELESALAPKGHLQALAAKEALPSLAGAQATQQAMLVRIFPVPEPAFRTPPGGLPCTYLVHYAGQAQDLNQWHWYYIQHHPRVMAHFPGIREIEICTRIDWCGFLPWPRVDYMQRNKVVFDSAAALTAALNSPVRNEMREDYRKFPPFTGENVHFPMATLSVAPAGVSA
ncbi:MAG TPA: hypothetical protein VN832_12935 [Stellaceae bacterium]|nr:hypothetical protein [Stellaceae bacterium]